jgi:2-oxoglutarate dehydrogenase E2 component (dihydrolipoamide succinyltransferase)
MAIEIKVPAVGESITEVEIGPWAKHEGDTVLKDETLVVLETEKATVEVPAPVSGRLVKVTRRTGELAKVGSVIAHMEEVAGIVATTPSKPVAVPVKSAASQTAAAVSSKVEEKRVMPAAARALATHGLTADNVEATGPGGRLLKEDVEATAALAEVLPSSTLPPPIGEGSGRKEEVVRMTVLRRAASRRLVEAQNSAALLTTFNEVDMGGVMVFRKEYGDAFKEKYGIKLGFMSFFVKATIDALKTVPQVNAEVRGENIVYRNYCDIGIAVSAERGLVVPVLRNAERMSFAEIESAINDFGERAKAGKLKIEELQGGTFTISNGGVFGSLLSTPIVNYPQSGILGMHTIQDRPVARDGQVVIRPMMYLALTYDHRLVDGREAVTFLKRIKETIEKPDRMLVEI